MSQYIKFTELFNLFIHDDPYFNNDITKFYEYCIEHNILREYLINHRNEVFSMLRDFYTEEMRREAEWEDREEQVRKEMEAKVQKVEKERNKVEEERNKAIDDHKLTIINMFKNGISEEMISRITNKNLNEIEAILSEN